MLLATIASSTLSSAPADFPLYRASVIKLPDMISSPYVVSFGVAALNDHGQFVATVEDGLDVRAYMWGPTGRTALAPLKTASDINNASEIVGSAEFENGLRVAVWREGVVTDLGVLPGDGTSGATAINTSGQVTGTSGAFPNRRAFFWDGTSLHDIGEFFPTDINDLSEIVGFPPSGPGVLWKNGITTTFNGLIINNALQYPTVGGMWDGEQTVCFDGSSVCDTNMTGIDINEEGDVVGWGSPEAFIWNKELGLRYLIELLDPTDPFSAKVLSLQCPDAINNNRQIIISCATVEGIESALPYIPVLLTPVSGEGQHKVRVPFPTTYLVFLGAVALVIGYYQKWKIP